jgi:tetratricopeptide (TPR) repeat protein
MNQEQRCGRFPSWSLPFFLLLLVLGAGNCRAQEGRGPALVIKGIAQYQDSALFESAIATLEEALKSKFDYRDSTLAYFYLGFSHIKLGQQEDGSRFFRIVLQRNPDAKLPDGAEEFADSFERIRQQVKQGIGVPVEPPSPQPADTMPTPRAQSLPESVYVKYPVYVGPRLANYLAGASAGAALGLASYVTSVAFDNLAADKVKAYGIAGDSAHAEKLKGEAQQYHSLGDVFYYSSYPLIAVGFYVGLKISERVFPGKVAFLGEDSPTRVYCSLDKDLNLSLGVRRSIW